MILYVGPDQIIPLSGFLGTVVGLALMFWNRILAAIRKVTSHFSAKNVEKP
jgi:hypothetical protein